MSDHNKTVNMLDVKPLGEAIGCGELDALNIAEDLIEMATALDAIHTWVMRPALGPDRRRFNNHPDSINVILLHTSEIVDRYKEPSNE